MCVVTEIVFEVTEATKLVKSLCVFLTVLLKMCVVTRKFSQYNLFFLKKEIDKVHSFSTFNSTKLGKCEEDKDGDGFTSSSSSSEPSTRPPERPNCPSAPSPSSSSPHPWEKEKTIEIHYNPLPKSSRIK